MEGLNIFIHNASKKTGMSEKFCDEVIRSMVKAVNNGVLDGTTQLAQLSRLKKKKFSNINNVSTVVSEELGYDIDDCKKVVTWMIEMMIQTQNQGGMPALIRMANLMKKGQETVKETVDYSEEIKDIDEVIKNKTF